MKSPSLMLNDTDPRLVTVTFQLVRLFTNSMTLIRSLTFITGNIRLHDSCNRKTPTSLLNEITSIKLARVFPSSFGMGPGHLQFGKLSQFGKV